MVNCNCKRQDIYAGQEPLKYYLNGPAQVQRLAAVNISTPHDDFPCHPYLRIWETPWLTTTQEALIIFFVGPSPEFKHQGPTAAGWAARSCCPLSPSQAPPLGLRVLARLRRVTDAVSWVTECQWVAARPGVQVPWPWLGLTCVPLALTGMLAAVPSDLEAQVGLRVRLGARLSRSPTWSPTFFVLKRKQVGWAAYSGQPTGGGPLQCALRQQMITLILPKYRKAYATISKIEISSLQSSLSRRPLAPSEAMQSH